MERFLAVYVKTGRTIQKTGIIIIEENKFFPAKELSHATGGEYQGT